MNHAGPFVGYIILYTYYISRNITICQGKPAILQ